MLTYTGSRNLYGTLTDNSNSTNLTFGDIMVNEGIRAMLSKLPWPFLEKRETATTTAGTQTYVLPGDLARLIQPYVTVGTYSYVPTEVTSAEGWAQLNNPTGITSDTVTNYYQIGNSIQFWPTPASSSNTIAYHYVQQTRDLNTADYTTGTITTVANGGTTITGSATSWTAGMKDSYIRITSGNGANIGDGLWYKIYSVDSATQITLYSSYRGTAITAGSAAYTIGNCSLIPEKFQIGPVYYAAAEYWRKQGNDSRADRMEAKYFEILDLMVEEEGTKGTSVVVDTGSGYSVPINPNLAKWAT